MLSSADNQTKSARRRKGPFLDDTGSDSDTDMPSHYKTPTRANRDPVQEFNFFDEPIEESTNDMRNEDHAMGNTEHATCPSQSTEQSEQSDLFVTNMEGQSDVALPEKDNIRIKSEPDIEEESELTIIDHAEASSEAQTKWSVPRRPIVIDLATAVKQEPLADAEPMILDSGSQSSIKALERRMKEIQSKALTSPLTSDEFAEMAHIMTQLSQPAKAPTTVTLPDPNHHEQEPSQENDKKKKRKRRAPVANAAEYWARREEEEQERNAKQQSDVHNNTSSKAKRIKAKQTRILGNNGSDLDDEELDSLIDKMLKPYDAIQHRADQGDLPTAPTITATRTNDQLKQMREAAPEYFDKNFLDKQKRELRQATRSWGPHAVHCKDGKWEVKGLVTPLLNHQLTVGAWMMGQELRTTPNLPRGGILADAMGLGKTIESLSCIVGNQASDSLKEAGKGTTLVICPSGQMISQWISEHCSKLFSRSIIHFKSGGNMDANFLSSFNIVFASYHQLRASTPSKQEREMMKIQLTDPGEYENWLQEQTGVLHRIEWHRVVLDEAHCIKNHLTHGNGACVLRAQGQVSLGEFFSYLKFIRCPKVGDFSDYLREYEAGRNKLASNVIYRTQGDFFLGQPILNLPTTHPTHQYLTLSAEEMVVYRMMERCFRNKVNQDLENGKAESQVKCYLTILLRLRQAATHPFLLESMMGEYFSLKDLQVTKEKLQALKGGATVYAQIGTWTQRQTITDARIKKVYDEAEKVKQQRLQNARKGSLEAMNIRLSEGEKRDEIQTSTVQDTVTSRNDANVVDDSDEVNSQDEVEEDENGMAPQRTRSGLEVESDSTAPIAKDEPQLDPFGRSDFGLVFDMSKQIEYLERLKEIDNAVCVACKAKPPLVPVKGRCGCIFCGHCVMAHLANKVFEGNHTLLTACKGRNCPKCRRIIGIARPFEAFRGDDTDEERENDASMPQENTRDSEYSKGFDYTGFQHPEDDKKNKKPIRFLQISDKRPGVPLTPSAKMTALKETILRWQAEAPDDKIIIFSQFSVVMKIIGRILESEGICFAYLSGKQNTEQRNKAVDEFQNGNRVKVLIVSLRAGGQCLNLTRGNRVILMELWWNHAVEQQAFARVFRIGQIKETHFVRFIVNTPIESRMLEMQVGKILAIDEALQDEAVRAPKISLKDIASLLGRVTTRGDGCMHIEPDNYDDEYSDDEVPTVEDEQSDLDDLVVPDDVVEYEDAEEGGLTSDDE
ncbi:LOW QUALITY PROTEIN: SNF2 family domain-containing protein [Colletotrichum navitas]|uniref:SNF2 family domain-containing protein n=1 Tax=Colletotrichum navitas TaxID=681940 RepID=A0AAD8PKA0_9PEZI|nr:LOW QUALITY PROTEIN: SNF2 family domain-containing protein [Colletotrichum navitas]KAK1566415.1 LOW QUALITY PROTEIN: SNF2 family domain-containing protein [Colletotrichum navitas]